MKPEIKNVIFDFGGVIVDLSLPTVIESFHQLGVNVEAFLGRYVQQGIFQQLETGEITPQAFCQQLAPNVPDEKVCEAWNSMLPRIPLRRLQAIKALSKRYHLSLLSNTNDIHWEHSIQHLFRPQGYDPAMLFEHQFLSQRMHLAKPGREIFEEVLRLSGYKPEETIFVDDSEANCKAFAELGVQTFTPSHGDAWLLELCPAVASIGFFDGVHRGHRYLIDQVKDIAQSRGMDAMLITFARHPREVLHADYIPQLLTSRQEKLQLLTQAGAERVEVLDFDEAMSQLTAREFMEQVLRDRLGVKVLVMGYDHRFGKGGGTHEDYVRWGKETGIEVVQAKEMPELYVSSSECRKTLQEGDVEKAAQLLGHNYLLTGLVGEGHHVGHSLGFPTANVEAERGKVVPRDGVYAVWVTTDDGKQRKGMLNIGKRPTLDNGENTSIEVNIIDFEGDIYGHTIQMEFVCRLRDEVKFDSLEALQKQLEEDRKRVLEILAN